MSSNVKDETKVAVAALLNLVRLLAAELVAGKHRDDVQQVEDSVRTKLNRVVVNDVSAEATAAGLARAQELVTPVLSQVRKQAERAKAQDEARQTIGERTRANRLH